MTKSLRILAADDESSIQDYYVKLLALLGHEVIATVGTGASLVERCASWIPI